MSLFDIKIVQARNLPIISGYSNNKPEYVTISPYVKIIFLHSTTKQEHKVQTSVLPPSTSPNQKWHEEVFTKLSKHETAKFLTLQVWSKNVFEGDCLLGEGTVSVDEKSVVQGILRDMWIPLKLPGASTTSASKGSEEPPTSARRHDDPNKLSQQQQQQQPQQHHFSPSMLRIKLLPLDFGLELDDLDDDEIERLTGIDPSASSLQEGGNFKNNGSFASSVSSSSTTPSNADAADPFAPPRSGKSSRSQTPNRERGHDESSNVAATTATNNSNNKRQRSGGDDDNENNNDKDIGNDNVNKSIDNTTVVAASTRDHRQVATRAIDESFNTGDYVHDGDMRSNNNNNNNNNTSGAPPKFSPDEAATKIQNLQRHRQCRSRSQERSQERARRQQQEEEQEKCQERVAAATKIQSQQRRRQAMHAVNERRREKLQKERRERELKEELERIERDRQRRNHDESAAATKIQSVERQRQARRRVTKIREQKREKELDQATARQRGEATERCAATKIQSLQRQRRARKILEAKKQEQMRKMQQQEAKEEADEAEVIERQRAAAAVRIQSLARQNHAKNVVSEKRRQRSELLTRQQQQQQRQQERQEKEEQQERQQLQLQQQRQQQQQQQQRLQNENSTAIKIQSLLRQRHAGAVVDEMRRWKKDQEERKLELQQEQEAKRKEQDEKAVQEQHQTRDQAAVKIQCLARRHHARKEVERRKYLEQLEFDDECRTRNSSHEHDQQQQQQIHQQPPPQQVQEHQPLELRADPIIVAVNVDDEKILVPTISIANSQDDEVKERRHTHNRRRDDHDEHDSIDIVSPTDDDDEGDEGDDHDKGKMVEKDKLERHHRKHDGHRRHRRRRHNKSQRQDVAGAPSPNPSANNQERIISSQDNFDGKKQKHGHGHDQKQADEEVEHSLPRKSDRTALDHLRLIAAQCAEGAENSHDAKIVARKVRYHLRCALRHWFYAEWEQSNERGISDFDDDEAEDDKKDDFPQHQMLKKKVSSASSARSSSDAASPSSVSAGAASFDSHKVIQQQQQKQQQEHEQSAPDQNADLIFITKFTFAKKCSFATCLAILLRKEFKIGKHREETLLGHLGMEKNAIAITTLLRFVGDHHAANVASSLCGLTLRRFVLLQRDEEALLLLQAIPSTLVSTTPTTTKTSSTAVSLATCAIDTIHGDTILHQFCRRRRPRANLIERYFRHVFLNLGNKDDHRGEEKLSGTAAPDSPTSRAKKTKSAEEHPGRAAASPKKNPKETETGTTSAQDEQQRQSSSAAAVAAATTTNAIPAFDINGKNANGFTPLQLVVANSIGVEGRSVFNLLVEFGASLYLRGPDGRDLMDMCSNAFIRDVLEEKLAHDNARWQQPQSGGDGGAVKLKGASTKAVNQNLQVNARVKGKIDDYPDILNLPRVLFSPGGIKRKNDRIELEADVKGSNNNNYHTNNNNGLDEDDNANDVEDAEYHSKSKSAFSKNRARPSSATSSNNNNKYNNNNNNTNKKEQAEIDAAVDRLYVNSQKQRSEFVANWIVEAEKRKEKAVLATYPRGHAPAKHVSPERLQRLVHRLHEESCSKRKNNLQRLIDEREVEDFTQRRSAGLKLSNDDMMQMGERLCNNSMSRKAANIERITAEMYPPSKTGGDRPPLPNDRVVALGRRLHDDSREHAQGEMKKLFDRYVPPPKRVFLSEEERAANAARLSPPRVRAAPKEN